MHLPKIPTGLLALLLLVLPFWGQGRRIIRGLSRKLLWVLCAVSIVSALVVLSEDGGGIRTILIGALLGIFAVYLVVIARAMR